MSAGFTSDEPLMPGRTDPLRLALNDLWTAVRRDSGTLDLDADTIRIAEFNHDFLTGRGEQDSASIDGEAMRAIWTILWHLAGTCRLSIQGTHVNYEEVTFGNEEFVGSWSDIAPVLIAWAELLQNREANGPMPKPPRP